MKDKKTATLSGTLMYPLEVGFRALICHDGHFTHTSRVTAIHEKNRNEVRFETVNTIYWLLLNPTPLVAEQQVLCMAA